MAFTYVFRWVLVPNHVHFPVNQTSFHMKGFAWRRILKQRHKLLGNGLFAKCHNINYSNQSNNEQFISQSINPLVSQSKGEKLHVSILIVFPKLIEGLKSLNSRPRVAESVKLPMGIKSINLSTVLLWNTLR